MKKGKYKTVDDHPLMGLDNAVCRKPVAYCISKRVYLSADDMVKKRCTCKPTVDLIGEVRCNWLRLLEGGENIDVKGRYRGTKTNKDAGR